jgi:hypothetical protein
MNGNDISRFSSVILLTLCLLLPWQSRAGNGKSSEQKPAQTDYKRLAGEWQRPDGGYILKLSNVGKDGKLNAEYFNPRSINVSKKEWRRMGDSILVFVELRDVNYPGSTYTLVYSPQEDRLEGHYYQAALMQTFDVVFVRMK